MGDFEKNKYKFSTDIKYSLVGSETIEARRVEIDRFKGDLEEYNILIKDLILDMPSYSVRNIILNISYFIVEDIEIFENMTENKKLPVDKLIKKIPITKNFLSKWNDYIITYTIIISNPIYQHLQNYLHIVDNIEILGVNEIMEEKGADEYRGIVIGAGRRVVTILTSKGEFKKINVIEEKDIGEEAAGKVRKTIGNYKLHIAILVSLVALMFCLILIKYNSISRTLVIETTSDVKLEVNSFNRVLTEYSSTQKGKEMLDTLSLTDEKLDTALYKILQYAASNEMIPRDGIIVTVTGKAIEYGQMPISETFISEEGLSIKFNNSGNEHKF